MRKEFENTDRCISESFCYTPETQQMSINYSPMQSKIF